MMQINKDKDGRPVNKSCLVSLSFDDICNFLVVNLFW